MCGEVTCGITVTLACSLSVAVTGPQLTVAEVFPSSAKTPRVVGQVSPNDGGSLSVSTNTQMAKLVASDLSHMVHNLRLLF